MVPALAGCASQKPMPVESPAEAWQRRSRIEASSPTVYRPRSLVEERAHRRGRGGNAPPIATVNGRPIARRRVIDLLLRSHGPAVLDQLIGLEAVLLAAEKQEISITEAEVASEYDRALRRLVDPLSAVTPGPIDRAAAERVLEAVLTERNVARDEFQLVMRRNAYLRKMLASEVTYTDRQLRREMDRLYGPRVRVRHIQLATLGEVERVRERLAAGEDFGALAIRHSANVASAEARGLLEPFSAEEEAVPASFRQVAFALKTGEVSKTLRIGEWYHLLKLEETAPPGQEDFNDVRQELERSLRDRRGEQAMFSLFEKLMKEATIEIHDPVLKTAYDREHAGE